MDCLRTTVLPLQNLDTAGVRLANVRIRTVNILTKVTMMGPLTCLEERKVEFLIGPLFDRATSFFGRKAARIFRPEQCVDV